MDRADEIRTDHGVSEADATERAEAESRAGADPYRFPEPGAEPEELQPFDDWLLWRT